MRRSVQLVWCSVVVAAAGAVDPAVAVEQSTVEGEVSIDLPIVLTIGDGEPVPLIARVSWRPLADVSDPMERTRSGQPHRLVGNCELRLLNTDWSGYYINQPCQFLDWGLPPFVGDDELCEIVVGYYTGEPRSDARWLFSTDDPVNPPPNCPGSPLFSLTIEDLPGDSQAVELTVRIPQDIHITIPESRSLIWGLEPLSPNVFPLVSGGYPLADEFLWFECCEVGSAGPDIPSGIHLGLGYRDPVEAIASEIVILDHVENCVHDVGDAVEVSFRVLDQFGRPLPGAAIGAHDEILLQCRNLGHTNSEGIGVLDYSAADTNGAGEGTFPVTLIAGTGDVQRVVALALRDGPFSGWPSEIPLRLCDVGGPDALTPAERVLCQTTEGCSDVPFPTEDDFREVGLELAEFVEGLLLEAAHEFWQDPANRVFLATSASCLFGPNPLCLWSARWTVENFLEGAVRIAIKELIVRDPQYSTDEQARLCLFVDTIFLGRAVRSAAMVLKEGGGLAEAFEAGWDVGSSVVQVLRDGQQIIGLCGVGVGTMSAADGTSETEARVIVLEATCATDFTGDGKTGYHEVLEILANWGPCAICVEDVNLDGNVGYADVLAVLAAWGPCPE